MGRKDAVPPQSDAESHSVRPQEGKRMKWGKRNSKRDNVRERETERESMLVQEKRRQCTQETQDKNTSLTQVRTQMCAIKQND